MNKPTELLIIVTLNGDFQYYTVGELIFDIYFIFLILIIFDFPNRFLICIGEFFFFLSSFVIWTQLEIYLIINHIENKKLKAI